MNPPFELAEFLSLFVVLNETLFPLPLFGVAAGLAVLGLSLAPSPRLRRLGLGLLGLLWCGIGVGYHALLLTGLTPVAWVFAAAFIVEGALLLRAAASLEGPGAVAPGARRLGLALLAVAVIVYPAVGVLAGHRFPAIPVLGVTPCPTGILTFGVLLLAAPRLPRLLFAIPLLWSGTVLAVAVGLGIVEDFLLTAAGIATLVFLLRERRSLAATGGPRRGAGGSGPNRRPAAEPPAPALSPLPARDRRSALPEAGPRPGTAPASCGRVYAVASSSISTFTPRGSAATCTVERAGGAAGKRRP